MNTNRIVHVGPRVLIHGQMSISFSAYVINRRAPSGKPSPTFPFEISREWISPETVAVLIRVPSFVKTLAPPSSARASPILPRTDNLPGYTPIVLGQAVGATMHNKPHAATTL